MAKSKNGKFRNNFTQQENVNKFCEAHSGLEMRMERFAIVKAASEIQKIAAKISPLSENNKGHW